MLKGKGKIIERNIIVCPYCQANINNDSQAFVPDFDSHVMSILCPTCNTKFIVLRRFTVSYDSYKTEDCNVQQGDLNKHKTFSTDILPN